MMMMVVEKGVGGDGVVGDDMGEGMQCNDHPYRNNPGGICAFCLQEKLGKLISSSKSIPSFPIIPSSSSSSPSFRSEGGGGLGNSSSSSVLPSSSFTTATATITINNNNNYSGGHHYHRYHSRRARMIPFLNDKAKKGVMATSSDANLVLERSKSSSVPRRQFFDIDEYSPRRKGFWSFFNLSNRKRSNRDGDSKPSIHPTTTSSSSTNLSATSAVAVAVAAAAAAAREKGVESSSSNMKGDYAEDDESPNSSHTSSSSFGRKVARSRSVGCGSRSFSGDFLERISTGFGDCTLRRVESHRETKPKIVLHHHRSTPSAVDEAQHIKERVKCGGIFGGFSSSSYLQSSSAAMLVATGPTHSRTKSWGWAFASPMRAFSKPSTKPEDKYGNRRDMVTPTKDSTTGGIHTTTAASTSSGTTPNLAAIPSLLAVGG